MEGPTLLYQDVACTIECETNETECFPATYINGYEVEAGVDKFPTPVLNRFPILRRKDLHRLIDKMNDWLCEMELDFEDVLAVYVKELKKSKKAKKE